jgi:hypothetical protein
MPWLQPAPPERAEGEGGVGAEGLGEAPVDDYRAGRARAISRLARFAAGPK